MNLKAYAAVLTLAFHAESSLAQKVYKCVESNGTTIYSPTPCGPTATEIDISAANQHIGEPSDAVRDIAIDGDCKRRVDAVYSQFNWQLLEVQREIDRERRAMHSSSNNLAGATRDNAISQRIAALESRKTTLLDEQNSSLNGANQACAEDQDAEAKRRAERDSSNARRRAEEAAQKAKPTLDNSHQN